MAYVMVLKTPPWYLAGGQSLDDVDWAFSPVDAVDLESSYVDLVGKAIIEVVVAPTLLNGWVFTGSQFLRVSGTLTQAHTVLIQFAGVAASTGCICGCNMQGVGWDCTHSLWGYHGGKAYYVIDGSAQEISPNIAAGNLGMAGSGCYRNGSLEFTHSGVSGFSGTVKYGIGGLAEWDTAPSNRITGTISRIVKFNITLSGPQMALVAAAMAV